MFLRFCFSRLPQLTQMTVPGPYDCQPRTFCSSCLFSSFCLGDQVIQVIPDSSPPPFLCPSFYIFYAFPCQAAALTVPNVHRVMQSVERGMALSWSKSSVFFGSAQFWYGVVVKIMKVMKVKIRETT